MSESLRQVVWKCDRCGGDAQAIFGIFPSCKCGSTSFKAAQPPAPTAQPASPTHSELPDEIRIPLHKLWADAGYLVGRARAGDVDLAVHRIKALCDEVERAIRAQPVQQPGAEFDHSIGADRFTVRRGSFWWHVRIGGSTSNVGKFHTKRAAEDMALKMLTAYRDGAFEQYQAARAHAAPAQRQPLPPGLRLAAAFTRADLGPDGSNYPHVRELLAFAEQALGITAAPEAQKGEKL